VAYDHSIVSIAVQLASRSVRDGDIVECGAGLEREFGDYSEGLVGNEVCEWVLGLFCKSFWKRVLVLLKDVAQHTHDNPWRSMNSQLHWPAVTKGNRETARG